jgi:hypothetical protein
MSNYVIAIFSRYGSVLFVEEIEQLPDARCYAMKACEQTPGRTAMIVPSNLPDPGHTRYRNRI